MPQQAKGVFRKAQELYNKAEELGLSVSISPHAPYTCSVELMRLINDFSKNSKRPLTIHNQESLSEDELFKEAKGNFVAFYRELGVDLSFMQPIGTSSLEWLLPQLPMRNNVLLVHNTFTRKEDKTKALDTHPNLYWCLCPKANLYIHDVTPDLSLFNSIIYT